MKIKAQNDYRIMVELSDEDMTMLDITYEEMDYSNIETRRVIWTLLDEARRVLGKDINPAEKMLIEAVPNPSGDGCILYFTVMPFDDKSSQRKLIMKKESQPVICTFFDADSVVCLKKILENASDSYTRYELFSDGENYRLLIYPKISETPAISNLLCEYGETICENAVEAARTREYWKKIL
ncbi:MAG: adaptor protein MecA [Clostridiales bacterium]|nr:adaptor protein MecA [Clostridiales bacterium]